MSKHIDMNPEYMRTIPTEWEDVSRVFVALGDEHRQRILLLFEKGERLNVSRIAEASTLSRPAVSHHLKILREANILQSEKIGKEVFFWINRTFLVQSLEAVLGHIKKST